MGSTVQPMGASMVCLYKIYAYQTIGNLEIMECQVSKGPAGVGIINLEDHGQKLVAPDDILGLGQMDRDGELPRAK